MTNSVYTSVKLHFQQGSSDKVYHVSIEHAGPPDLYNVTFAYGRRGGNMTTGTKNDVHVDLKAAIRIYDKLVAEKIGKGYQVMGGSGHGPINIIAVPKANSGIYPMLLSSIDQEELEQYLEDDAFLAQEKIDGERRMIKVSGGIIRGINRKGIDVALPGVIQLAIDKITTPKASIIFDGEQIGDDYYAFDLHESPSQETATTSPFKIRYQKLAALVAKTTDPHLHLVKTAEGFAAKSKLYEKLMADNKEGIVFRHKDGLYTQGRSQNNFKFKFYETASFIVIAVNQQRSVQMGIYDRGKIVPVGNVTIPVNHVIPQPNTIIEVRYLYAYQDGSIYQPVYLGERTDLVDLDCNPVQLKYKPNISLI